MSNKLYKMLHTQILWLKYPNYSLFMEGSRTSDFYPTIWWFQWLTNWVSMPFDLNSQIYVPMMGYSFFFFFCWVMVEYNLIWSPKSSTESWHHKIQKEKKLYYEFMTIFGCIIYGLSLAVASIRPSYHGPHDCLWWAKIIWFYSGKKIYFGITIWL